MEGVKKAVERTGKGFSSDIPTGEGKKNGENF